MELPPLHLYRRTNQRAEHTWSRPQNRQGDTLRRGSDCRTNGLHLSLPTFWFSLFSLVPLVGMLTVGGVAFEKAGEHRVTLRADPARARHGLTGGAKTE